MQKPFEFWFKCSHHLVISLTRCATWYVSMSCLWGVRLSVFFLFFFFCICSFIYLFAVIFSERRRSILIMDETLCILWCLYVHHISIFVWWNNVKTVFSLLSAFCKNLMLFWTCKIFDRVLKQGGHKGVSKEGHWTLGSASCIKTMHFDCCSFQRSQILCQ